MSNVTYRVSARPLTEVESQLQRLWHETLSPEATPEDRIDRLYRNAPVAADTVHVLEAIEGDQAEVIGSSGLVRRTFWVAGQEVRAAVSCDLAVRRQHRALGPALSLVRAVRADVGPHLELIYGFPNEKAEAVMKRAGFQQVGRARRWVKVLRAAHYIERLLAKPHWPSLSRFIVRHANFPHRGALLFDAMRGLMMRFAMMRLTKAFDIGTAPSPDARWNDLWLSAREDYEIAGDRSESYVGWRFKDQAGVFYVTLQRRGDPTLGAYAVMQLDATTGAAHVRDVFGHRALLAPLLDALPLLAWRAGAASVSVRFLGAPAVERHLTGRGFAPRDDTRSVVYDAAPALAVHASLLADPSRWHLFDFDEES